MTDLPEPLSPLQESAAASKELYDAYLAVGFSEHAALELTKAVVVNIGARVMAAATEPTPSSLETEWRRRTQGTTSPNVGAVCRTHGLPVVERILEHGQRVPLCLACEAERRWAERGAVDEADRVDGMLCAVCHGPLYAHNGQLICPDHPPPDLHMGGCG